MITKEKLTKLFGSHITDEHIELLNKYGGKDSPWAIVFSTKNSVCQFLSQTGHESNHYKVLKENLNYSKTRLLQVFPKYFNASNVDKYASNPSAIANRVYANRMGNKGETSGEGYKYRGRGLIQLTGKNNYTAFMKDYNAAFNKNINFVEQPELLETLEYAIAAAVWFWFKNKIYQKQDTKSVTLSVNGGSNGLAERETFYKRAVAII